MTQEMGLDGIVEAMKLRFKALKVQREAAMDTAAHLREELQKIHSAWSALAGSGEEVPPMPDADTCSEEATSSTGDGRAATPKKGKPTLKRQEVRELAIDFLAEGPAESDAVLKHCGGVAEGRELSRKGLHFVVRGLLRDSDEFEQGEDGTFHLVPGKISLVTRVRSTLKKMGPLTEGELKKRVAAVVPLAEFEPRFRSVMRGVEFEFNGSRWALRATE